LPDLGRGDTAFRVPGVAIYCKLESSEVVWYSGQAGLPPRVLRRLDVHAVQMLPRQSMDSAGVAMARPASRNTQSGRSFLSITLCHDQGVVHMGALEADGVEQIPMPMATSNIELYQ
jgi:hypothetical protein